MPKVKASSKKTGSKKASAKKAEPKQAEETPKPAVDDEAGARVETISAVPGAAVEDESTNDSGAKELEIDFMDESGFLLDAALAMGRVISNSVQLPVSDCIVAHTFFDALADAAKEGKEAVRPFAIDLAKQAGGKVEDEQGKIVFSEVAPQIEVVYTDATVELLETKGVLDQSVTISATLKEGVDVETMPEADLEIVRKYFDVQFTVDPDKVAAQVTLGKVEQDELDATTEAREVRKGYERLKVTPADSLKKYFSER